MSVSSWGQTYFLNGSATSIGSDCYELTPALTTQNGTVWYSDQLDLNLPFDLMFQMNFGSLDANGADGICFVLQTVGTSAIGESGGGMGYLNFGNSLGIEFDTWQNSDYGDPFEDHLAIEMNGDINHNSASNIAGPVNIDPFGNNVEDGQNHTVQITWDPITHVLQVYYDCVFRLEGEIDLINEIFGGESLVYWGFTAATGGSVNTQTVCLQENILSIGDQVDICTGASTILSAGSSIDGNYSWSPADYLDDPTSSTPLASPPSSITYTVTFTDLCDNAVQAEIDVVVDDLEITLIGLEEITCINDVVNLTAETNLNLTLNYDWTNINGTLLEGTNENQFSITESGAFAVTVDFGGVCTTTESFEISENLATYSAAIQGPTQLDCNTPEIELIGVSDSPNAVFAWFQGANNLGSGSTITVDDPLSYVLTVTNPANGCTTSDLVTLTSNYLTPNVTVADQDSLTCLNPSLEIQGVQVSGTTVYDVSWSTESGNIVSGNTSLTPLINAPGVYIITVEAFISGCSTTEEVWVYEDDDFNVNLDFLLFPNILTINNDALNEEWRPFLFYDPSFDVLAIFSEYELHVFNRWGTEVFLTDTPKVWEPKDLEGGVYYYTLKYATNCGNGASGDVSGTIELVVK
ncbi:MAG: lectin-like domain-containing protein [Flavobacteriales bacterium]